MDLTHSKNEANESNNSEPPQFLPPGPDHWNPRLRQEYHKGKIGKVPRAEAVKIRRRTLGNDHTDTKERMEAHKSLQKRLLESRI